MDIDPQEAERRKAGPFLMAVQDVFAIKDHGTVVTGWVERGTIRVGDPVEIVGLRPTRKTEVVGLEVSRKPLKEVHAGECVGVILKGIEKAQIEAGQRLAAPGSIAAHSKFKAKIAMYTKEEGGRPLPFVDGHRLVFGFRPPDIRGSLRLPSGRETMMPGETLDCEVTLDTAVALGEGALFAICDQGKEASVCPGGWHMTGNGTVLELLGVVTRGTTEEGPV